MRHGSLSDIFYGLMHQAILESKPDDHPSKERTLQRYGELIIEECVKVCTEGQQEEHVMGLLYSKKIKRHFGIE